MEAYNSSSKLELASASSLLHSVSASSESSQQSSSNDVKRKPCSTGNLIAGSGLASDLSSLYALENLHHHHHHHSTLPHHSHSSHSLVGPQSIAITSTASQSIQTAGSLIAAAAGSSLCLPGKFFFFPSYLIIYCTVYFINDFSRNNIL